MSDRIKKIIEEYCNGDTAKNRLIDISEEAYNKSYELFKFKDMRRGVIEHGKNCYIEGYKKHAELFNTFLTNNGYFTEEELHKITAEFEASLKNKP